MSKKKLSFLPLALFMALAISMLAGCSVRQISETPIPSQSHNQVEVDEAWKENADSSAASEVTVGNSDFDLSQIPEFSGDWYYVVNDNVPYFTEDELSVADSYEAYSPLDDLGRCGVAEACVGMDLMPTEERESISEVKPSGWQNHKYDFVDGGYVYNRCHLIGFQLTGENANPENLITGTRSMNVQGMLPFENMVADYIKETENHVLYRVTPVYDGDDLVASGVLMEASSIEDSADGIQFCVYCYNVEPGVCIDYATGDNWEDTGASAGQETMDKEANESQSDSEQEYVLNTKSMKFHNPDCSSVEDMADANKKEVSANRDDLISEGYSPCGICKP